MADASKKVRVLAVNVYPAGPTYCLHRDDDGRLEVCCTQGVLRAMLGHARKGLTVAKGGLMEREAIEVKGWMLGRVEQSGRRVRVVIERTVELPLHALDNNAAAYFTATDHVLLDQKLRKYDGGQLIGYYHSHPMHPVRTSEQDVQHFRENLTEAYQLAAIVGPGESATGFFLQRELDGYTTNQEPEFRVDYEDDMPVVDNELAVDEAVGFTSPPARKKGRSLRSLLMLAALLAVVAVATALITSNRTVQTGTTPILRLSDHSLDLDPLTPQRAISLSLDAAGACDYTVRTEGLTDWLSVDPQQGEIVHPDVVEVVVLADMSLIAAGDSLLSHVIVEAMPRNEGAEVQTTTIPVMGVKNIRMVEQSATWRAREPTVGYGGITWDLSDCPVSGGEVTMSVALSVRAGREETAVFERAVDQSRLRVTPTELPSPLDWSELLFEARAAKTTEHPDRIVNLSSVGTASLVKSVRDWTLPSPEMDGGSFTFVTLPLPTTAHWAVEVAEGDGWRRVNQGVLASGQSISHTRDYDPAIGKLRIRAAFVGENGIDEYRYVYAFSRVDRRDVAFDRSQGTTGRSFRVRHADRYAAADLAQLGVIGGPRHYADLDGAATVGWVLITGSPRVDADAWPRLLAIGDELASAGHGRFAWFYNFDTDRILLVFAMPDDGFKAHCDALVAYPEVLELISDTPNGRLSIRPPDIEDEDAFNLGSYRLPR
jgi:proteasome lid subunit RPN8/RPN11